jgi:hypothetical protein
VQLEFVLLLGAQDLCSNVAAWLLGATHLLM